MSVLHSESASAPLLKEVDPQHLSQEPFPAGDLLIVLVLSLSKRDLFHRELWRVVENCILPCRWHLGSNGRIYAVFP